MKTFKELTEAGIKWKMSTPPTGKWKSFDKRHWPMAYHASGDPAIMIRGEDAYSPHAVKTGDHKPLTVYIAQHHFNQEKIKTHGAFTWRKLKNSQPTLADAKASGERTL